ncbi:MAG TPA: winged helix-turn-helix transcriptional regulator [Nanoarchaeota archaeon]|nr:winged helix-turn-helix transcriptional regulator [Nanoarchaeota archaeon]
MDIVLILVKSPEIEYNANSIAKIVNITPSGALKILRRLEKESVLKSRRVGQAIIYNINTENKYALDYVSLILTREKIYSVPRIKRWVEELKKIKHADTIILYGSVLKSDNYNDVDVVFVTNNKLIKKLEKEINELNNINVKRIHPLYQTSDDLINNIKKNDKVLLNAIKGIIVKGENNFVTLSINI